MYSPTTCVFLSGRTNTFIEDCGSKRGKYMLGVDIDKRLKLRPFTARCSDPFKRRGPYLGMYETEMQAHLAWKQCKHAYALELANTEQDSRVKESLRTRYL